MKSNLQIAQRIIAEQLGIDECKITPEKDLYQDLHLDSLDNVELIMAFEEEFDININDADVENFRKVSDIVDYMDQYPKH